MSATATTQQQLVVLSLGDEEYALRIQQVQEIIRYTAPRAVASADPWVRGVISLRGKIIPVLDLGLRLGLSLEPGSDQKIVIVEAEGGTTGVVVDDVEEVVMVDDEQLDDLPGNDLDAIDQVARIDDRLVMLLEADRLVA
jgi:purine-binding chemotaxis protein CheW